MSELDNSTMQFSLSPNTAKNLSHHTISIPMMESITPRWFLTFLPWVPVEAGVYRLNRVRRCDTANECREKLPGLCATNLGEHEIAQSYPDYEEWPREYTLSIVQTILRINGQVADVFNSPIDQMGQQMRLTVEAMKEQQEWEMINNREFGLAHNIAPSMRVACRTGAPTPDDMDELLARVWRKPAFFLAHPRAIAAFGRECTRRGVPPATVMMYGSPFITWRGVPMVPCDKLMVDGKTCCNAPTGRTHILLMRVGEREQGVIGLHQPGIPDEHGPSLSVRFMGIDTKGIASYVLTLYFSTAVLTDNALGMLTDVEVGMYHDYA